MSGADPQYGEPLSEEETLPTVTDQAGRAWEHVGTTVMTVEVDVSGFRLAAPDPNARHARVENDFYETPGWVTRAILPHLRTGGATVLEPAAGEGAILRELVMVGGARVLGGVEIDPTRAAKAASYTGAAFLRRADFLDPRSPLPVGGPWEVIITNPPFSHAEAFVRRSLDVVAPGGTVAMFLRLAFLESQGRAALLRERPPDVFILPARPSFKRSAGRTITDRWAYAWFVWGPGRGGRWQLLDDTRPKKRGRGL